MAEREPETKTYKQLSTGRVETAVPGSDVEKALKEQGYVEIDPETGEVKNKKDAAQAAAATVVKPLNPDAKVTTEADDEIASATVETKQPSGEPTCRVFRRSRLLYRGSSMSRRSQANALGG